MAFWQVAIHIVFDWNTLAGKKTDSLLDVFINNVLADTKSKKVELIGHSAGGGLGRAYLIDSAHAAKVAHYIHIGSRKWFTASPYFPNKKCLNIYSMADTVTGKAGGDIEGASNLTLKDKDHYQVATSEETFNAIYQFINNDGKYPVIPTHLPYNISLIAGKAVLLGSNEPMANATIAVYELNDKTGLRNTGKAIKIMKADTNGNWGSAILSTKKHYEFELIPDDENERTISYFYEPFKQNNYHIYLRGFPKNNMIGAMLGNLPNKDEQSVIVLYSATKAIINGRDSVTVNGIPVSSPSLTPASKTIISSFIFDDGDGKTSGEGLRQFSIAPFLGGVDIALPVSNKTNVLFYNGRKLYLPAMPSKERIMLAVFN
jgi:hypothetical protein